MSDLGSVRKEEGRMEVVNQNSMHNQLDCRLIIEYTDLGDLKGISF